MRRRSAAGSRAAMGLTLAGYCPRSWTPVGAPAPTGVQDRGNLCGYGGRVRTIDWVDGAVEIIDQTALPGVTRTLRLSTVEELVDAVQRLAVRGAPALGVAGAMGVALAAQSAGDPEESAYLVGLVETARPTAVNLARGARRAAARLPEGPEAVLAEALAVRDEEIENSA